MRLFGDKPLWMILQSGLRIVVGTFMTAAAFQYITFPNNIVAGGLTGISQILHLLFNTPVGMMMIAMNIPLFLLAWKKLGRAFVVMSLISMLLSSVFIDLLALFPLRLTSDPLLAAVFGGLIEGAGWGIVYTTGASGGGIDIPTRLLRRKFPYMNFGMIQLAMNGVIILAFAVLFDQYDRCMYTIICMYMAGKIIDIVGFGPLNAKLCYIITDCTDQMVQAISDKLERGVTLLHGEGSYSRKEKEIIMCVVKKQQITELRQIVREIDPWAFTVVGEARSVYGDGFDSIFKED